MPTAKPKIGNNSRHIVQKKQETESTIQKDVHE